MNSSKENLKHTKWECKYHVVFIPKCRRKVMYGSIRQELGSIIRDLAQHKESEVEEGHLMADHVHMMLTIPPKYSVSGVVGYIKGKSAIAIARRYMDRKKNFVGLSLWARGTTCQQWDETRRKCASTSESRRKKTDGSIN